MSPKITFLLLVLLLSGNAGATAITFNDLNLVDRGISVYMVNETGSYLISTPDMVTSNTTLDLDPTGSYQIVIEPDSNTWFDDPRNAMTYLLDTAAGQSITFVLFAMVFVGIIRLIFK